MTTSQRVQIEDIGLLAGVLRRAMHEASFHMKQATRLRQIALRFKEEAERLKKETGRLKARIQELEKGNG